MQEKSSLVKFNCTLNRFEKDEFRNFINFAREKYRGNGEINFFPCIFVYENKEIAISALGYLYYKSNPNEFLEKKKAFEIWNHIYKNQDQIIPIKQEQKIQQVEIINKEDEAFINEKVKNLMQIKKI